MKTKFTLSPWADSNRHHRSVRTDLCLPVCYHYTTRQPYIFIRSEAHAGAKPCLRYFVIR